MAFNETLHQEFTRKWGFDVTPEYLGDFITKNFSYFTDIFKGIVNPKEAHSALKYHHTEQYLEGLRYARDRVASTEDTVNTYIEYVADAQKEIDEYKGSVGFFKAIFRRSHVAKEINDLEKSLQHRRESLGRSQDELVQRKEEVQKILDNPSEWEVFVRASEVALGIISNKYSIYEKLSPHTLNELYVLYRDHCTTPRNRSEELVEFYENGYVVMLLSTTSTAINFEKTTPKKLLEELLCIEDVDRIYRDIVLSQMVGCTAFSPMPARAFYQNYQTGHMLEAA